MASEHSGMADPFVVVGGDAAGLSAASKAKREAPERDVVVFEKGRWVSYAHCGTPYFVKGEVDALTDLLSLSPDEIRERGIDLRREHEVVGVDVDGRTVTVRGPDGERRQPYGELLIATGARAATPIPGAALDGAFTMHGLDAAAAVRAYLTPPETFTVASLGGGDYLDAERAARYGAMTPPETVAVVGGGYVGIEMAEAFSAWDVDVHLFQRSEHVPGPFGEAVAERVEERLAAKGVTLHLGTEVESLRGDGGGDASGDTGRAGRLRALACADGTELAVEAALVGVGIRPNVSPVDDAVELGDSGAVAVDEYGRTSAPDVYAAGDCAAMPHAVTGDLEWAPLGPAVRPTAGPSGVERPMSSHADRRWMRSPVRTA